MSYSDQDEPDTVEIAEEDLDLVAKRPDLDQTPSRRRRGAPRLRRSTFQSAEPEEPLSHSALVGTPADRYHSAAFLSGASVSDEIFAEALRRGSDGTLEDSPPVGILSRMVHSTPPASPRPAAPVERTNIEDIRNQLVQYENGQTRYLLIGLDYDCAVFDDFQNVATRISTSLEDREFDSAEFQPDQASSSSWIEPFWLDIQSPSLEDMQQIEHFFSLHKLTTEDCLCNDSGEKWELFPNYLFVCVRTVDKQIENQFEELNVLVFRRFVITIHQGYFEEIDMVLVRIQAEFEVGLSATEKKLLHMDSNVERKYNIDNMKARVAPQRDPSSSESMTEDEDEMVREIRTPSTPTVGTITTPRSRKQVSRRGRQMDALNVPTNLPSPFPQETPRRRRRRASDAGMGYRPTNLILPSSSSSAASPGDNSQISANTDSNVRRRGKKHRRKRRRIPLNRVIQRTLRTAGVAEMSPMSPPPMDEGGGGGGQPVGGVDRRRTKKKKKPRAGGSRRSGRTHHHHRRSHASRTSSFALRSHASRVEEATAKAKKIADGTLEKTRRGVHHYHHHHDRSGEPVLTSINSPCWILYLFIDVMTDIYIPLSSSVLGDVERIDELVLELRGHSEDVDLLRMLGFAKKKMNRMKKLLITKHSIVLVLMSSKLRYLSKETAVYFRDVVDHLQQCLDKLESAREALNQSHSNYMIKVSIEIAKSSKQTDSIMNRISLFASILGPLALISGIWGMNVPVPGQYTDTLWWFFGIILAMLVISFLSFVMLSPQLIPDYYDKFKGVFACCCRGRKRRREALSEARRHLYVS